MHTFEDCPDCHPLSLTRNLREFPIGNIPLEEHQRRLTGAGGLNFHPHAWVVWEDVENLDATLVDASFTPLAWHGNAPDLSNVRKATGSFLIRYPWDLLRANEAFVAAHVESAVLGDVHPLAVVDGVLRLGKGSRILPGVFIEGNVLIGENCKIGPNCYIRGNTAVGDSCHIGQSVEIKNSLILSHTNVGHLSYIGDSVLGHKVNLGAGTTTSNLRHDGTNHRSMVGGVLVDTGRRKFGAIIGDHVHTGINTSIYPARKLWPHVTTRPGEIVQADLSNQTSF